ncbi:MAG: adenylyl-sulfate reductase subunit beta [Chloroflexi bacterium]|nr:adenylyl-sulfate reductase subunit beta [Chloroflexota bacterium]
MPSFVNPEKCDGCKGRDRTACQYICPNDLMTLDQTVMKANNREPDLCWECYSCVKICPQGAIEVRGYADFVPLGAGVTPMRGTDTIMWAVRFRDGRVKRFRFPTRTKPEGSIQPYNGFPEANPQNLKQPFLAGEPEQLGAAQLPGLARLG